MVFISIDSIYFERLGQILREVDELAEVIYQLAFEDPLNNRQAPNRNYVSEELSSSSFAAERIFGL